MLGFFVGLLKEKKSFLLVYIGEIADIYFIVFFFLKPTTQILKKFDSCSTIKG